MDQLGLFGNASPEPDAPKQTPAKKQKKPRNKVADEKKRIERAFRSFDEEHPQIYEALVRLAKLARSRDARKKWSINALFERARWEMIVERGEESFKLNNNYRSYYARKIMQELPEFKDFFSLRELRASEPVFVKDRVLKVEQKRDQMEGIR